MHKPGNSSDDLELEAYLDGVMSEAERSAFMEKLRTDPQLQKEADLQNRIDASLGLLYPRQVASATWLEELNGRLSDDTAAEPSTARTIAFPWKSLAAVAAAAMVGWALFSLFPSGDRPLEPYFAPSPVAQIYKQTVEEGFEPYYECHEEERFRETFLSRQGIPLKLESLPVGSTMLGLSYPGGLSRDTTAMLCLQNEEPVMVFIDRVERDQPVARENQDPSLNVFREVRDGLVFYEVTPFGEPTMIDFLVIESP